MMMKKVYNFLRSSLLSMAVLVAMVIASGFSLAHGQSVTINIPYGGNSYGWNPWVYNFSDPLPANTEVTGVSLKFTAVDQGWGGTGADAQFHLTDTNFGYGILQHYSTTHFISKTGSFPNYVYGGNNTLKLYFWGYPGWVAYWQGGVLTINYEFIQPLVMGSLTGSDISCNGGSDGTADLSFSGGKAPFTYSWSNGATTEDLSGVPAGTYSVVVTDAKGKTLAGSVTLAEPALLEASVAASPILCFGGTTDVSTSVTGGTAPYTYLWSDNSTGESLVGASVGNYNVTVTDANGCLTVASLSVGEPAQLLANAGSNSVVYLGYAPAESALLDGSPASGGTAPYSYEWFVKDGAAIGTSLSLTVYPVASTHYVLVVTDANGCIATDEASVCVFDISVPAPKGGKGAKKVYICHIPEGNPANAHTISVSVNAVPDHLAHGDKLGPCGTPQSCDGTFKSGSLVDLADARLTMENKLSVYPNPVQGDAFVEFTLISDVHTRITLVTMTGTTVQTLYDGISTEDQESRIKVDTQSLSKGVYFIKMNTGLGMTKAVKMIVN